MGNQVNFLAGLKGIVNGTSVPGGLSFNAARTHVGWKRYDLTNPEFFSDLVDSGPRVVINIPHLMDFYINKGGTYTTVMDAYFGFSEFTDEDMTDILNLIDALNDRLKSVANWSGYAPPTGWQYSWANHEITQRSIVMLARWNFWTRAC